MGVRGIFAKSSPVLQRATTRVAPTCCACPTRNVGATLVVALPTCKHPTRTPCKYSSFSIRLSQDIMEVKHIALFKGSGRSKLHGRYTTFSRALLGRAWKL